MNRLRALVRRRKVVEDLRAAQAARHQNLAQQARRTLTTRQQALVDAGPSETTVTANVMRLHRTYGIALYDGATEANADYASRLEELKQARREQTTASVDRRIAERLVERARADQALLAARQAERALDEAAMQQWRRTDG